MCSRVVLPALSKPRNTSFPDFLYKPRRKTNEQEKLQQAALSMGAEMPRRLTLFIYEPLSQSCTAACAFTVLPAQTHNSQEKNVQLDLAFTQTVQGNTYNNRHFLSSYFYE